MTSMPDSERVRIEQKIWGSISTPRVINVIATVLAIFFWYLIL